MSRKSIKNTKTKRDTNSAAPNLNSETSGNQGNTTSTEDNSSTPPINENNNSTPTEDNSKKSNRGCLGINKPRWFQWNLFPKDGQPLTLTIFEFAFYFIILLFFFSIFIDFNKISHHYISIEVESLNNNRYLKKGLHNDTIFQLYYRSADLNITIPKVFDKSDTLAFKGSINRQHKTIKCVRASSSLQPDGILLRTNLSPLWYAIYDIGARESGFHTIPNANFKDNKYEEEFYNIRESILLNNKNLKEELYRMNELIPDSLTERKNSRYRIKLSSDLIKLNYDYNSKDSILLDLLHNPFKNVIIDPVTKNNLLEIKPTPYYNKTNSSLLNKDAIDCELLVASNINDSIAERYNALSLQTDSIPLDFHRKYVDRHYDHICFNLPPVIKRNQSKPISSYFSFEKYDISKGWYHFTLNSSSIDSISLKIDFVGATDFYPMDIVPDEIGSNFISYTDMNKILQIKQKGLKLYVQFKETENRQTIRVFAVTAIISGILVILITFMILGFYRTSKVFNNYLFKKK